MICIYVLTRGIYWFFFCEIMYNNKALVDRILNTPSVNDNNVMMYRKAVSLIEQYNRMARNKGLPVKNVPVYDDSMNCTLMARSIGNILKDIDRVKNIKVEEEEADTKNEKIKNDVSFNASGIFTDGLWTYHLEGDNIEVDVDSGGFSDKFGDDTTITLNYDDMPYEKLIDTEEVEFPIDSYDGLFHSAIQHVTILTIDDWTNYNVTDMSNMFLADSHYISMTLGDNFDTSSVTDMDRMFADCASLESLTLGNSFNTSNVENMSNMFSGCRSLKSITLYKSAESIIKELPGGTWKIDGTDNTITVTQGQSANWSSSQPNNWDTVPIKLIYQSSQ